MEESERAKSLQDLLWLINDVDQLIEHAMLHRSALAEVIPKALDRLLKYVAADAVTVRVPDEDGLVRDFTRPVGVEVMHDQIDSICERLHQVNSVWHESGGGVVYGQRLDLRVEFVGAVIAHFTTPHDEATRDHTQRALFHWAEMVDNYIAAISDARVKQEALAKISDGFKNTILEKALEQAIASFREYVEFDSLLLVCQSDEVLERSTYSYRFFVNGEMEYSSATPPDSRVEALVEDAVERLLRHETVDSVIEELNVRAPHLEDLPIYDLDGRRIVGRIVLGTDEVLSRFSSDLLDRFADYLRQRVVDFSREWRHLSHTFSKRTVERLLREPDYHERFLQPREEEVAILYADISGFTRLCEQVLLEPRKIGRLIDRWSRRVVSIVWETGGVFDKMVGDCIIALWGPPFYTGDRTELCREAADAARRIREYTSALVTDPDFPELQTTEHRVGVAVGLSYCPAYVGLFGPNEDFTAFSAGMNNTARLQGLAEVDQILCMDSFVSAFGDPRVFGEEQMGLVKNVEVPLRYRELL